MFGMPGQHKNFGMGVVFDAKNNAAPVLNNMKKGFQSVHDTVKQTDRTMKNFTVDTSQRFKEITRSITGFVMGTQSFRTAWDWGMVDRNISESMAKVGTMMVDGKRTIKEINGMQIDLWNALDEHFRERKIPIGREELARNLYTLMGSQIQGTENLIKAADAAAIVAKAGAASYQDAVEAFKTYQLVYGKNFPVEKSLSLFQDAFAGTIVKYPLDLRVLSAEFRKTASVARGLNWDLRETTAALAMIASTGNENEAGTYMRGIGASLGMAGEKLKMNFFRKDGSALGLFEMGEKLRKRFGQIEGKEIPMIQDAFGREAGQGIIAIVNNLDALKDSVRSMPEGAALDMYAVAINNTNDRMTVLNNSVDSFKSKLSDASFLKNETVITRTTDAINKMIGLVEGHPKLSGMVQPTAYAVGGAAAGFTLYKGIKWLMDRSSQAATAVSEAQSVDSVMMKTFGSNIMSGASKAAKPSMWSKFTGLLSKLPGASKFVEPMKFMGPLGLLNAATLGNIQAASYIASKVYPLKTQREAPGQTWLYRAMPGEMEQKELSQSQRMQHEKYFGAAAEFVPVVQAPYSDQRKLEVNVTINGEKVDAELLSDSQIDRITQKFSDAFFVNPLRMGTQGAPPQ